MRRLAPLLTLPLAACAFTDVPLHLPPAVGTGLTGGDGRVVVVVTPFTDARPDPGRCGMQKNGAGAETAKALCSEDPARWLATLLANELRAAGFTVVQASDGPSAVRVEGTLLQLFAEPLVLLSTVDVETDVRIRVVATSRTGLEAERTFFVKAVRSSQGATAANFQKSIDLASQRIARDVVAAILSLMNRYPELGARGGRTGGAG